jgi:RecB family exonuclease
MEEKELNKTAETQPTLIKLSASSTKTFESCKRKYYYTYIEKLPKKSWPHLMLGTFCHAVLEQFHSEWKIDKNLVLPDLMGKCFAEQRCRKESNADFSSMLPNSLEEAKVLLQEYLFNVEKNGMPNVLATEAPFIIQIDDCLLRGSIDRIDVDKDGIFHIVDYKTSKNEKYLDNFQLLVYGIALKNKYPDLQGFRGSYLLLRKNSRLITEEFGLHDILKCEKKIIEFGKNIKQEQKWAKSPSPLCNWCDFYDTCMGGWG